MNTYYLKKLRLACNMSVRELSRHSGVSEGVILRLEKGLPSSAVVAVRLRRFIGASYQCFFEGLEDESFFGAVKRFNKAE